jgi:hypothetical protein
MPQSAHAEPDRGDQPKLVLCPDRNIHSREQFGALCSDALSVGR